MSIVWFLVLHVVPTISFRFTFQIPPFYPPAPLRQIELNLIVKYKLSYPKNTKRHYISNIQWKQYINTKTRWILRSFLPLWFLAHADLLISWVSLLLRVRAASSWPSKEQTWACLVWSSCARRSLLVTAVVASSRTFWSSRCTDCSSTRTSSYLAGKRREREKHIFNNYLRKSCYRWLTHHDNICTIL